jgi:hypothetical protein
MSHTRKMLTLQLRSRLICCFIKSANAWVFFAQTARINDLGMYSQEIEDA